METPNEENKKTFLVQHPQGLYWDWFAENPVEIILVVFILIFFFFLPREHCGITPNVNQLDVNQLDVNQLGADVPAHSLK